jgi:ribosomal protein L37AE/L43A
MIALDIGRPSPQMPKDEHGRCPSCKAPKNRRIDAGGFGVHKLTICEDCGHEFKETA